MKRLRAPIFLIFFILTSSMQSAADNRPLIIGGVEATPGAWPFMVGLFSVGRDDLYQGQFCGGSLINAKWVLTAAHCFDDGATANDVQVGIGLHDLEVDTGEIINVSRVVVHPNYNSTTFDNDVALLELATSSTTGTVIQRTADSTLEGTTATAIGWGRTIDGDENSAASKLRQVDLPIVADSLCSNYYGEEGYTENMLCTGFEAGGKDACQGDSGGPLVISEGGVTKLAGVTSFGDGCGQAGAYGVFARVSQYSSFISSTLGTGDSDGPALVDDGAKIYGLWNGFLGMTNIIELVNRSNSAKTATVNFFNISGTRASTQSYTIEAGKQLDVILNNIPGFIADSYGVVQVSDNVEGRIFYYRPVGTGFSSFEFAFGIPLESPTTGNTAVGFNTYQPSSNAADQGNLVANWLSIVNLESSAKTFVVKKYALDGSVLSNDSYSINPGNRLDIDGGHVNPGPSNVGLIRIEPSSASVKYLAQLMRYGFNQSNGLDFAFPLLSKTAASTAIAVPLGSTFEAQNWLEVVNTSSQSGAINVKFYADSGALLSQSDIPLEAFAQSHLNATGILGAGEIGLAVITPTGAARATAQSMLYFRDATTGSIQSMYGSQARVGSAAEVNGSFNLFLGMENYLKLSNLENSTANTALAIVSDFSAGGTFDVSIPAHGTVELDLHDVATFGTLADSYGVITVTPAGGAKLVTENLRVLRNSGAIEFAAPTGLN